MRSSGRRVQSTRCGATNVTITLFTLMELFSFRHAKSLFVVISLLCRIAAPFPPNSPGRQPPAHVVGENNDNEEKNEICREHYGSPDYIYVPGLDKCEPCSFACPQSTDHDSYCKACPTGTSTAAGQTTSTAPPTQAPTTVLTTAKGWTSLSPNTSDQGNSSRRPKAKPPIRDESSGVLTEAPPKAADKLSGTLMFVGIFFVMAVGSTIAYLLGKRKMNNFRREVGDREDPETNEELFPTQDSQPAPSVHPMTLDIHHDGIVPFRQTEV